MKKIFILICCVGLIASANAQSVSLGIKAGPNFSSLNTSQITASNRTGYHFGAYALFKFSKIGIQPELLYSKQGASVSFNSNNYDANYDYINIPILLKLYLAAGLNIQVGPQFGFATSTQLKAAVSSNTSFSSAIKNNDLSAAVGLGWDLPFGLSVDARYNLGLSNNNNISGSNITMKNQVFMASVGYRLFKLGK